MHSENRYDFYDRPNGFRAVSSQITTDEPFPGTFQPSSYSNFPDNRSFENYLNLKYIEDGKKYRDTQSFDIRSKSSLGFDKSVHQSGSHFYEKNESEGILTQDKIIRLENVLSHKESIIEELKLQKAALSKEIDELIQRLKDKDAQTDHEINKYLAKIEELQYHIRENEEFIRTLQLDLDRSDKISGDNKELRLKLSNSIL